MRVYSIWNCCDTYICVKIQIVACTCKCTLAKFGSFVLVWCFKYSVPLYQLKFINDGALKLLDCVTFLCYISWLKLHTLMIMLRGRGRTPCFFLLRQALCTISTWNWKYWSVMEHKSMGGEKGGKIIRFSMGMYLDGKFGFQTFCLGFPSNIDEYLPLFVLNTNFKSIFAYLWRFLYTAHCFTAHC